MKPHGNYPLFWLFTLSHHYPLTTIYIGMVIMAVSCCGYLWGW